MTDSELEQGRMSDERARLRDPAVTGPDADGTPDATPRPSPSRTDVDPGAGRALTDPADIPTEPGWYRDHNGHIWLLLPDDSPAGFYGMEGADAIGVQPYLAGLDRLRSLRPFTRINHVSELSGGEAFS